MASDNQAAADEAHTAIVIEPMPNATVACSGSVLAIVLSNLMRNAIKYIDGGESELRQVTVQGGVFGVAAWVFRYACPYGST